MNKEQKIKEEIKYTRESSVIRKMKDSTLQYMRTKEKVERYKRKNMDIISGHYKSWK